MKNITYKFLEMFSVEDIDGIIEDLTSETQKKFTYDLNGVEITNLQLDLRAIKHIKDLLVAWGNSQVKSNEMEVMY